MAEIAIKIGGLTDGDVAVAFSGRAIRYMHASMICQETHRVDVYGKVQSVPARRDPATGLVPSDSIDRQFLELIATERYERTSRTTVDRVEIATGQRTEVREPLYEIQLEGFSKELVFGFSRLQAVTDYLVSVGATGHTAAIEGANRDVVVRDSGGSIVVGTLGVIGKHCFVELYLAHAYKTGKRPLFGEPGAEVWYGGRMKHGDESAMQAAWVMIERETSHQEQGECSGCGAWHTRTCMSREREPEIVTLGVSPGQRRRLLALGRSEPFAIKYFGSDRQYHVGHEGDVVELIGGGAEARNFLFVTTDAFDDAAAESLHGPLRHTEDAQVVNVATVEPSVGSRFGTYRLTLEGKPLYIKQMETLTIGEEEYLTSLDGLECNVSAKAAPKAGPATVTGIVHKRKFRVDWPNLPGLSPATAEDIPDRTKRVDIRGAATFPVTIAQAKGLT